MLLQNLLTHRKYQVSADGCVAQTRLAKVMLTNSLVLKEESAWIEYYYRCVENIRASAVLQHTVLQPGCCVITPCA